MSARTAFAVFALAAVVLVPFGCNGHSPKCVAKCAGTFQQPEASSDSGVSCPATEPAEGSPCAKPGLSCAAQYGSLSCPESATCDSSSHWRITCPKMVFGSDAMTCSCPHPGG